MAKEIKAKVELTAKEASLVRDAIFAYQGIVKDADRATTLSRVSHKIWEAFGENRSFIH